MPPSKLSPTISTRRNVPKTSFGLTTKIFPKFWCPEPEFSSTMAWFPWLQKNVDLTMSLVKLKTVVTLVLKKVRSKACQIWGILNIWDTVPEINDSGPMCILDLPCGPSMMYYPETCLTCHLTQYWPAFDPLLPTFWLTFDLFFRLQFTWNRLWSSSSFGKSQERSTFWCWTGRGHGFCFFHPWRCWCSWDPKSFRRCWKEYSDNFEDRKPTRLESTNYR